MMQHDHERARKSVRWALIALAIGASLLCLMGACVGYPVVRIKTAKSRVRSWCAAAPAVGQPADATKLAAEAASHGLQVIGPSRKTDGSEVLLAYDNFLFARWFCDIKLASGQVSEKNVTFLD